MKIDKLIKVGNLPKGNILVAILEKNILDEKKWKGILQTIPVGVGKIGSVFRYIILAQDAIEFGIPYKKIQEVENYV